MNKSRNGCAIHRIVVCLSLMTFALPLGLLAQEGKFGVIDVRRLLTESIRGKAVLADLETLQKAKAEELQQRKEEFESLQARYSQTRLTLAEDKLAEMEKQLEDMTIDLRRAQDDAQREFQTRQTERFGAIEQGVLPIVTQVGRELGYTLIFNKFESGLLFADEGVDLTDLVIERYDRTTDAAAAAGVEN